jgi:hypothetical protein
VVEPNTELRRVTPLLEARSLSRRSAKLQALALVLLATSAAIGAPRDNAATKKIDEAINTHYLATDFKKAEEILLGTIKACEDKCSPEVLGKAWMYVGLVRGGKGDQKGAQEAFATAVSTDPNVKLDADLASPETKASFEAAGGGGSGSGGAPAGGSGGGGGGGKPPKPEAGDEDAPGNMKCTPENRTIQTNYPIPVSCTTDEDATSAELKYKAFGETEWQTLKMKKKGDAFQATIPCEATDAVGEVKFYVRAKDKGGDNVDSLGSKSKPAAFKITNDEMEEGPSFPDGEPVDRCKGKEECPPGMEGPGCDAARGNKAWGDSCANTQECKQGLACTNGQCEEQATCTADNDCTAGNKCVAGACQAENAAKKNYIGLHFGADFAFLSGDNVCSSSSQKNDGYACFSSGDTKYGGATRRNFGGKIAGGIAPGTYRALASYERLILGGKLGVGGRLGFAFNGGPEAGGTSFLPVHVEPRVAYYFLGTDKPLRPYVAASGGVAQVDAKLQVSVIDCTATSTTDPDGAGPDPSPRQACQTATSSTPSAAGGRSLKLDAYRKLGQGFGALSVGTIYMFTPNIGAQINLNAMFMLPTSGIVIEPSVGGVYGF